jgi:hypothetical protein
MKPYTSFRHEHAIQARAGEAGLRGLILIFSELPDGSRTSPAPRVSRNP